MKSTEHQSAEDATEVEMQEAVIALLGKDVCQSVNNIDDLQKQVQSGVRFQVWKLNLYKAVARISLERLSPGDRLRLQQLRQRCCIDSFLSGGSGNFSRQSVRGTRELSSITCFGSSRRGRPN